MEIIEEKCGNILLNLVELQNRVMVDTCILA